MPTKIIVGTAVVLGLFGLLQSDAAAQAQFWFVGHMRGSDVVPPTPSPGHGDLISEPSDWQCGGETDPLNFTVTYDSLAGSPIGAGIYRGAAGSNGTEVYSLFSGYFPSGSSAPLIINFSDCVDIYSWRMYIVIRTDAYPEGEVRGFLEPREASPSVRTTWGTVRAVYR